MDHDFHDRLRERLSCARGGAVLTEALSRELSRLRCAFFFLRLAREQASSRRTADRAFSVHERSGYGGVVLAFLLVSAVEVSVAHLLLRPSHPLLAGALFLGGAYGVIWLLGDYQAVRLRPFLLEGDTLHLRLGVRRELSIARAAVRALDPLPASGEPSASAGYTRFTACGTPELLLRLRRPVTLTPGGRRPRAISTIGITVDDPTAFGTALLGP